ncbi:MAG TPA: hypothetical protein VMU87_15975 [Stellaceae bacterium]|nr:hypothetical protein [Stellaceae bacterium]
MTSAQSDIKSARMLVAVGTQFILCGFLVLMIQCFLWIGDGHWSPCNIGAVLHWTGSWDAAMGAPGGEPIIGWILAIPLCAWSVAMGFVIAWIGATNAENAAKILDSER